MKKKSAIERPMTTSGTPPSHPDVEAATLAILMEHGADAFDMTSMRLTPEHYYFGVHGEIFGAIRNLIGDNKPCDTTSVIAFLTERNGSVDGDTFAKIESMPTTIKPFPSYVEKLDGARRLRMSIHTAEWILGNAYGGTGEQDVDGFMAGLEQQVFALAEKQGTESVTRKAMDELQAMIDQRRNPDFGGGIKTGIAPWDSVLGGIFDTRLYVIGARPGRGKTAMLEEVVMQMVSHQHPVVVFEKDMPVPRFLGRIACRLGGISFYKFERGLLTKAELDIVEANAQALRHYEELLHIYDPVNLTASDIHSIVRREKRRYGTKAWFLDYIQLLNVGDDTRIGLTNASMELKRTINETGVSGVVLAQLNRLSTTERPTAAHIKEFDQLHADAACVMLLWTKDDPASMPIDEPLRVEFTIDKNNFGPVSDEFLMFNRQLMKFYAPESVNY
jgi:replicative DNA helicase